MSDKWSRLHGSEDMDLADKNTVRRILRDMGYDTYFNFFMVEWKDEKEIGIKHEIYRDQKDRIEEIHRPDVIAFKGSTGPGHRFVVEIDGGVHKGGRKDRRRNDFYERHRIPYIVINKADLRESGLTWDEYLDESLASIRGQLQ